MKIRIYHVMITIFFLTLFFIFYKGLKNSNIYTPNLSIKKDIPIFEAKLFDSNNFISSKKIFKENKFYIINIWASWCAPCRQEHEYLVKLSETNNLKLIGINYKDDSENAKKFLKEMGNPYSKIFKDSNGTVSIQLAAYGVPETFIIDKNKKIIKKIIGPIDKKIYNEILLIIK